MSGTTVVTVVDTETIVVETNSVSVVEVSQPAPPIGPRISFGATAPESPLLGDIWIQTNE